MFRGLYTAKVDDKGRVSFPARFREVLAKTGSDELFVTTFRSEGHPCLDAYPQEQWLALEDRLRQNAERSPRTIKYFQNVFLPGVQECQVDRQGRILLANRLRESAELGHEVVFVGLVDKLRIWSVDNWNVVNKKSGDLSEDPEVISMLGVT
jgi:MraZ protein